MKFVLSVALALAAGGVGGAQTSTQGAIGGTVFDTTGAIVSSASITIHMMERTPSFTSPRMTADTSRLRSWSQARIP